MVFRYVLFFMKSYLKRKILSAEISNSQLRPVQCGLPCRIGPILLVFFLLMTLFLLLSCGTTQVAPPLIENETEEGFPSTTPEYKIQVEDQLDVKFFFNTELNERVMVRPDGRISLQLVKDVVAAGLTPSELTAALKEQYSLQIANPEISVIVRTFEGNIAFIDGEVNKPGQIKLSNSMSVMQSIAVAGGLRRSAFLKDVMVIRKNGNKPLVLIVNVNKIIRGEIEEDLLLQPYDIVYVPRTPINSINQWVRDYVMNFVPYSFTAGYNF